MGQQTEIKTKTWKDTKNLVQYSKGGIVSKELLSEKSLDVTLFCMAKDTSISEHTSTKEGFVYVIEGKGSFNLEGEDIAMLPGLFIHMKKNAAHSLRAQENTSFILSLRK